MNQFTTGEQDPRVDANENVQNFLCFDWYKIDPNTLPGKWPLLRLSPSLNPGIASAMFGDVFPARSAHVGTYWIPEYEWWDIDNDSSEVPHQIDVTRLVLEQLLNCWKQGQSWKSFQ